MADGDGYYEGDNADRLEEDMIHLTRGGGEQQQQQRGPKGSRGLGGGRGGSKGGGGGGGKSAGKGKGGSGGGGGQNREMLISKALSTLLRHQAENAGIRLDAEGFAPLDKVMQWPRLRSLNPTLAEIRLEVRDNAKQRFTLKPNPRTHPDANAAAESSAADRDDDDPSHWLIRANQGHSIGLASEALHAPITLEAGNLPAVVVHGTYFAFWDAIVSSGGLKRMGRQHVHFGTGLPDGDNEDVPVQVHDVADEETKEKEKGQKGKGKQQQQSKVISGMRNDAEILIFVDVERSLRDGGIKWWLSANGVVLTEGDEREGEEGGLVPTKYFKEVRGRAQGVGVLWRDGVKVADLPEGVKVRIPMGKNGSGGRAGGGARGGGGGGGGGRGRGGGKQKGGRGGRGG
ncbi:RNA 2'-phosphotransferase, Tpt1 [Xylariomycetidae sp. FL2044]|nr:RNA 2'-phosphotransferase, Tpt1 [Xylariomycetidae sp. FL2044]